MSFASSLLIVVPTLNSHTLLPRLLNSLKTQTWPNWSLLFVDGPSSGEHRQWLETCCESDSRCSWIPQDLDKPGIFGAMNQGFAQASENDWLLFWGSDDFAAAPDVFAKAMAVIESSNTWPDLIVCRGRYIDASTGAFKRATVFHSAGLLSSTSYRRALMFGSTPPHQATFMGPGARRRLAHYDPGYRLSADLDYFLRLGSSPDLRVHCLDLELVHMADAGVSGQQTQRRLQEVRHAYRSRYGVFWWFAFVARYLSRLSSLL